jgi:hypothetical protein
MRIIMCMSNTVHLNITLPTELARKVRAAPNQSALIAESLREKFARDERAELSARLIEAYEQAAVEDQKINDDWDATIGDGF